jgi:glycosyltransferase involved in cell wall biosynthesis
MRIAIANWSVRRAGGAETYLALVIPALLSAGHEVAFLCELDKPADRQRINLPDGAPLWCASEIGADTALARLREWKPGVVYAHRFEDPAMERGAIAAAASVFFAHDYYGTCISGDKTVSFPRRRPCSRKFGARCFMHYYPRRCGGLNPLSMWNMFRLQSERLASMRRYDRIVTASEHMRREYLRHGLPPDAVQTLMYPIDSSGTWSNGGENGVRADCPPSEWRLVFAGRMTKLKGGTVLLDALPRVSAALDARVALTFIGDGPARPEWEAHARRLVARDRNLRVEFSGWLAGAEFASVARQAHLHVMPSVWPEPFGRSGLELGAMGVPSAAFAVGGISDWLRDGVNGFLAPGDTPGGGALADAIVRCLNDGATYARLRAGALESARRFRVERHIEDLVRVFGEAASDHGRNA